jgi:hypothetical protein
MCFDLLFAQEILLQVVKLPGGPHRKARSQTLPKSTDKSQHTYNRTTTVQQLVVCV